MHGIGTLDHAFYPFKVSELHLVVVKSRVRLAKPIVIRDGVKIFGHRIATTMPSHILSTAAVVRWAMKDVLDTYVGELRSCGGHEYDTDV